MADVTSIGEAQLRLNTLPGTGLEAARQLNVHVAGTEGNVLGLLARLGHRTGLVTALPRGPLSGRVVNEYRSAGIDLSAVVWRDSGRLALYFVEHFGEPVPSRVVYDRRDSCFANLTPEDVDWAYVLDTRLVHLTGITAALTSSTGAIVLEAVTRAREAGRLISFDVNHRVQLSSPEAARDRLGALLPHVDLLFCSRRDAATLFGIDATAPEVAAWLQERFGVRSVLVSDGPRAVAVIHDGRALTAEPPRAAIVDRVGAGDALIGGFLHGYLRDDPELGLRLGIAAAALALASVGEQIHTSLAELEGLSASFGQDIFR